jgi:hypothetical protein
MPSGADRLRSGGGEIQAELEFLVPPHHRPQDSSCTICRPRPATAWTA